MFLLLLLEHSSPEEACQWNVLRNCTSSAGYVFHHNVLYWFVLYLVSWLYDLFHISSAYFVCIHKCYGWGYGYRRLCSCQSYVDFFELFCLFWIFVFWVGSWVELTLIKFDVLLYTVCLSFLRDNTPKKSLNTL